MKVLHVISGISRQSGGPSRSSQGLVAGLNAAGVETYLVALRPGDKPWIEGVDRFEAIDGTDRMPELLSQIKPDIVHIHGIWSLQLHAVAQICRRWNVPYVIAPRGMLEPWSLKQKWLKKRIARFVYQDGDLKHAAALHATAESEAEQFRALGFTNPIIISPNGVNLPKVLPPKTVGREPRARRALFVSRMHPKKGVLELVDAWAKVKPADWCCELVYTVGSGEERAYEQKIRQRVSELGLADQFIFTGKLDDDKKWEAYVRADLFVLPTYSENFGIVVPEALYAGVPVITTKGTPWQDLVYYHCGWWIDLPPTESLVVALREAISSSELRVRGENGRRLVNEKYTWDAVCKPMVAGYEAILNGRK